MHGSSLSGTRSALKRALSFTVAVQIISLTIGASAAFSQDVSQQTLTPCDEVNSSTQPKELDVPITFSTGGSARNSAPQADKITGTTSDTSIKAASSVNGDASPKTVTADVLTSAPAAALPASASTSTLTTVTTETTGPAVMDNDEAVKPETSIQDRALVTDEQKTKVQPGSRFAIILGSQISSKTAKKGEPLQAQLKYDLKIGEHVIAKKGSTVNGHIDYVLPARTIVKSGVSSERRGRTAGCIGLTFDEVINENGEHLPLVAKPAEQPLIIKNAAEGRCLGVNKTGQITGPFSQQLKYNAFRVALSAAMIPAGAFSFGAAPAAMAIIGAVNPSFAFMKPIGTNVTHRRLKGFALGALGGAPGGILIQAAIIHGQEAIIKPGDEFLAEFKEEFNGLPSTETTLVSKATTRVEGQVLPFEKKVD